MRDPGWLQLIMYYLPPMVAASALLYLFVEEPSPLRAAGALFMSLWLFVALRISRIGG